MRVGTAHSHTSISALIGEAQARQLATQNELASGRKVTAPSDDPVGSAHIVLAEASLAAQNSYAANSVFLDGELRRLESTLGALGDSIISARELLIAAGNSTYSNADRKSLAATLSTLKDQTLALANSRGADGQYLFSGFQSTQIPFFQSGGSVMYAGDTGTRGVLVGTGQAIQANSDGLGLFMSVPSGNGSFSTAASPSNLGAGRIDSGTVVSPASLTGHDYAIRLVSAGSYQVVNTTLNSVVSSGAYVAGNAIAFDGMRVTLSGAVAAGDQFTVLQGRTSSVFDAIDQAIAALSVTVSGDVDRSKLDDAIRQASANLEQAHEVALSRRAEVGGRMVRLEQASNVATERVYNDTVQLSRLQDTDYVQAASRLAQQQSGLQAALAAYGQTSKLSLFDYIR